MWATGGRGIRSPIQNGGVGLEWVTWQGLEVLNTYQLVPTCLPWLQTIKNLSKVAYWSGEATLSHATKEAVEAPSQLFSVMWSRLRATHRLVSHFFFGRRDTYQKITLYYVETAIKGHHKCLDCKGWFQVSFLDLWLKYTKILLSAHWHISLTQRLTPGKLLALRWRRELLSMRRASEICLWDRMTASLLLMLMTNKAVTTVTTTKCQQLWNFNLSCIWIRTFPFPHSRNSGVKVCTCTWSFSTCGQAWRLIRV